LRFGRLSDSSRLAAYAVRKIDPEEALESYRLFDELFAANASDGLNPAIWLDD
jgi:hypothetical protein